MLRPQINGSHILVPQSFMEEVPSWELGVGRTESRPSFTLTLHLTGGAPTVPGVGLLCASLGTTSFFSSVFLLTAVERVPFPRPQSPGSLAQTTGHGECSARGAWAETHY